MPVCAEDIIQAVPFVTNAGVVSGDKKTIEISMCNSTFDVANLQFDILLPEGMSLTGNTSFTTRIPRTMSYNDELDMDIPVYDFSVQSEVQASGYTRFMFIPGGELRPIETGSGSFIKLRYTTASTMQPGIYPILMTNIKLVKTETESISIPSATSFVVISADGTTNPLSTEATVDLSGMTGALPSFVVEQINADIASNTSLRKLDLSGVTNLGAELVVPENALWYTSNAAKLNRTYSSGVKCTVCLPFSISASNASAMGDFYKFSGIEGGKVVMEKVTGDIEANTPYIFVPSSAQTGIGATSPSPLTVNFGASPQTENATDKFTFIGTYEPITWDTAPTGIYGFAVAKGDGGADGFEAGEFVLCGAGANIPAYRAYLKYTGEGTLTSTRTRGDAAKLPTRLPIIWRSGADTNVTGIETLDTAAAEESGAWYGLNGQRYAGKPSAKGIYVNNGKKVIVK